jgi:hypothetical protein
MKIKLQRTVDSPEHEALVFVDGKKFGTASDCDLGRWIISKTPTKAEVKKMEEDIEAWLAAPCHPLTGCYPAKTLLDLACALRECVRGVTEVTVVPAGML